MAKQKMDWNDLQRAAFDGSAERTAALLSKASIDVNEPNTKGFTPLIMASQEGHHHVVAMLIEHGARLTAAASGDKATALMMAAQNGYVIITKLLIDAGAELDASNKYGATALQLAADGGYIGVVEILITAGAKVDASDEFGNTPILCSAEHGHLAVVKALASAGANIVSPNKPNETPLFAASVKGHVNVVKFLVNLHLSPKYAKVHPKYGNREPLNGAARHGYTAVVRELLRLGVEACGGPTRGRAALAVAAMHGHVDIVAMLRGVGVIDTEGDALVCAIENGREASVKVLLRKEWAMPGANYVNDLDFIESTPFFFTPLCNAVGVASPKIVRLLLDAGADERLVSRVVCVCTSGVIRDETPLMLTTRYLAGKILKEEPAGEEAMHRLEAIRRLLLRVDAIRAVSWLWPSNFPRINQAVEQSSGGTTPRNKKVRKPVHIVRHRERVRRGILATLFR